MGESVRPKGATPIFQIFPAILPKPVRGPVDGQTAVKQICKCQHGRDSLSQDGGEGSSGGPHIPYPYEQIIQQDVGQETGHHGDQREEGTAVIPYKGNDAGGQDLKDGAQHDHIR